MDKFEELVRQERVVQEAKWGEQNHDSFVWMPILMEEVGEVAEAILYNGFGGKKHPDKDIEHELTQVAAVCKAIWECGKRNGWVKEHQDG